MAITWYVQGGVADWTMAVWCSSVHAVVSSCIPWPSVTCVCSVLKSIKRKSLPQIVYNLNRKYRERVGEKIVPQFRGGGLEAKADVRCDSAKHFGMYLQSWEFAGSLCWISDAERHTRCM